MEAGRVLYRSVKLAALDIFYREAGPKDAPTVLLLHGFPTSSQMSATSSLRWRTSTMSSRRITPGTGTARCRRGSSFPTRSTTWRR
jgi:hypothetical protein